MNWGTEKAGIMLAGLVLLAGVAQAGLPARMQVQVKEGQLRQSPSFLGQIVARLNYGTQVAVLKEQGAWAEVSSGADKGWLHSSALNAGRAGLAAGSNVGSSATRDEVALAGKGFDQNVENSFRSQNPSLDFTSIDKMESLKVAPEEIQLFLAKGELPVPNSGGVR